MSTQATVYHWLLTLHGPVNGQQATVSNGGLIEVLPGETRSQIYDRCLEHVLFQLQEKTGHTMQIPAPVFFSLEPDQL